MKLKALLLFQVLTFSVSFADVAVFEPWRDYSRPGIFADGLIHKFSALPVQGSLEMGQKGWSGDYWPAFKGHINIRWNAPGMPGFDYVSPTLIEARAMTQEQLAKLSPTEKFDLLNGRYDYPLKKEVASKADPYAPEWNGICHGWSPASINHNEPTPKVLTNPDGIVVPFGSSDIKALLSYYYAYRHKESSTRMGKRCNRGVLLGTTRTCDEDLNAGAFHIIVTNMLALKKEPFVADVERYKEVWNQPVIGFESKILKDNLVPSRKASKEAVKEMEIQTKLHYVIESDKNTWEVVRGTSEQKTATRILVYRIELNAFGEIVGGTWESRARPDFLWIKPKATSFKKDFVRLSELLND